MLNNKQNTQVYIYSCDNISKFKKFIYINAKVYLKNVEILESKNAS